MMIDLSLNDEAYMVASMAPGFFDYKNLPIISQDSLPSVFIIEAYENTATEGATINFNGVEYYAFAKFQKIYQTSSLWISYIFVDGYWFVCSNTFDKAAIEYYDDTRQHTTRTVYLAGGVLF